MHKNCFILILFFLPVLVFAETAAELEALMETDPITVSLAARFTMGAAGLPQDYQEALSRGWVKGGPDDAITMQEAAFLMMNVFELKGGIMYSILHNPRYAYREMIYKKLIHGQTNANMKLSGRRFLQILGKTLDYKGEREEMDALLQNSGAIN